MVSLSDPFEGGEARAKREGGLLAGEGGRRGAVADLCNEPVGLAAPPTRGLVPLADDEHDGVSRLRTAGLTPAIHPYFTYTK